MVIVGVVGPAPDGLRTAGTVNATPRHVIGCGVVAGLARALEPLRINRCSRLFVVREIVSSIMIVHLEIIQPPAATN